MADGPTSTGDRPSPEALSVDELIEEAEGYKKQAETDPEAVVSELPRLLELIEWSGFDSDELVVRDCALSAVQDIANFNPETLGSYYPTVIEKTLDTTESKLLTRKLLHETVELIARDVTPTQIEDGLQQASDEVVNYVRETVEELDTEERLPGNGAMAMGLAQHLQDFANSVDGRAQLAVEAYANALLDLVRYRAAEQGLDPIDSCVDLKARYAPLAETFTIGFSETGTIEDMMDAGETQSSACVFKYLMDSMGGTMIIVAVEETVERILRAEAVIAEQLQ